MNIHTLWLINFAISVINVGFAIAMQDFSATCGWFSAGLAWLMMYAKDVK